MAALNRLVAGVAHEFHNPVGAIQSTNDTLRRWTEKLVTLFEGGEHDVLREYLRQTIPLVREGTKVIATGSARVTSIVQRMTAYAHLDQTEPRPASLEQCIEEVLAVLPIDRSSNLKVIRDYDDRVPPIPCRPAQVNQMVQALLLNAIEAVGDNGTISVATQLQDEHAVLTVEDTGVGISNAIRPRIFDPGFTTKNSGVGTGLGLSISHEVVRAHSGTISVNSEEGEGTVVTVRFPIRRVSSSPGAPIDIRGRHGNTKEIETHLTEKERELVAVGISVATGCKPCTARHVKAARRAGATRDEIRLAVGEAISVRSSAMRIMEQHALGQLGGHCRVVDYNGSATAGRIRQLVLIGAAFAVNCATNLERYLDMGRRAGISDWDIYEVAKLANIIKGMAAAHVDRMVEARQPPHSDTQEQDAAAGSGG